PSRERALERQSHRMNGFTPVSCAVLRALGAGRARARIDGRRIPAAGARWRGEEVVRGRAVRVDEGGLDAGDDRLAFGGGQPAERPGPRVPGREGGKHGRLAPSPGRVKGRPATAEEVQVD